MLELPLKLRSRELLLRLLPLRKLLMLLPLLLDKLLRPTIRLLRKLEEREMQSKLRSTRDKC